METENRLQSFPSGGVAVVLGAGGIGAELVRQIGASGRFDSIIVASRSPDSAIVEALVEGAGGVVEAVAVDVLQEASIAELAAGVAAARAQIRMVICAFGILHQPDGPSPERRLEDLSSDSLARLFAVNAVGPALVARHLAPLLPRRERSVFAALSARVGSIGDNRLGGWYAYRASKAALNQLLRCTAIELKRRAPGAVVAALHPGTVDTPLSKPFQSGVALEQLFSTDHAARRLLSVIDSLAPDDSGGFFAWDGSRIPW